MSTTLPLSELSGFDATGLSVYAGDAEGFALGSVEPDDHQCNVLWHYAHNPEWEPAAKLSVSLADPATVDRLLRYVAERLGVPCPFGAPSFEWVTLDGYGSRWELRTNAPHGAAFARQEPRRVPGMTWSDGWHVLPEVPVPEAYEQWAEVAPLALAHIARWAGRRS